LDLYRRFISHTPKMPFLERADNQKVSQSRGDRGDSRHVRVTDISRPTSYKPIPETFGTTNMGMRLQGNLSPIAAGSLHDGDEPRRNAHQFSRSVFANN
jgi:hypothetical protein